MVIQSGRILIGDDAQGWLERRLAAHRAPVGSVTLRTGSGEAYLVRDRATADGGRVMVFTDITDRFRAETALAEQQDALAASRAQAEAQKSLSRRPDAAAGPGQRQGRQRQDHPAAHHGP